jgi:uncharacterized protein YcfL
MHFNTSTFKTTTLTSIAITTLLLTACSSTPISENASPTTSKPSFSLEIENSLNEKVVFESHENLDFDTKNAQIVSPEEWVKWYNEKLLERNNTTQNTIMELSAQSFSAPNEDSEHKETAKGVFLEISGLTKDAQEILVEGVLTAPGTPEENQIYELACETFNPPKCAVKKTTDSQKNPDWEIVEDSNIPPGISIIGFPEFPETMPSENATYYISQDKHSGKFIIKNQETQDISFFSFDEKGNSTITKTVLTQEGKVRSDAYQQYTISTPETKIILPEILQEK